MDVDTDYRLHHPQTSLAHIYLLTTTTTDVHLQHPIKHPPNEAPHAITHTRTRIPTPPSIPPPALKLRPLGARTRACVTRPAQRVKSAMRKRRLADVYDVAGGRGGGSRRR
jgi:hypothetical protein